MRARDIRASYAQCVRWCNLADNFVAHRADWPQMRWSWLHSGCVGGRQAGAAVTAWLYPARCCGCGGRRASLGNALPHAPAGMPPGTPSQRGGEAAACLVGAVVGDDSAAGAMVTGTGGGVGPSVAELPFCELCSSSLLVNSAACPKCGQPDVAGVQCRACVRHPLPIEGVFAPWCYGGALAHAIWRLKFRRDAAVAVPLAGLLAASLATLLTQLDAAAIVPIPHHWTRRWRRGYDQNLLLLAAMASLVSLPVPITRALRRKHATVPQAGLPSRAAREPNLRDAFAARRVVSALAGKTVVLFDDVLTTGATFASAATTLHRAGVARVYACALARTP